MGNPVLVEVVRGGLVESRHCGAIAVVDADGRPRARAGRRRTAGLSALGHQGVAGAGAGRNRRRRPLWPRTRRNWRSPAPRTAASPAMSRPRRACSRSPVSMRSALKCGAHWPIAPAVGAGAGARGRHGQRAAQQLLGQARRLSLRRLRARSRPRLLRRAGASGAARGQGHAGKSHRRYDPATDVCAIDGCSVPTWAVPLDGMARAFARFGTGAGLAPERAKAAARLRAACAEHPWHVAGTGRFCTEVMQRSARACS